MSDIESDSFGPSPRREAEHGWERLFSRLIDPRRIASGEPLLPDPSLPQDPAFVAFLIDGLRRERDEALDELEGMVGQHCTLETSDPDVKPGDPPLDSMALSDNASAMRLLADYGRLTITSEAGRRVIGRFIPADQRTKRKDF